MQPEKSESAPSGEGADIRTIVMPRRWAEAAVIGVVMLVAIGFLWGAQDIRHVSDDVVGPSTFPRALSIILIAICTVIVVAALRLPSSETITIKRPTGLAVAMVLLIAFPVLVDVLGYYVLIIPWLLAFGWAARVRSPFLIAVNLITVLFVARVVFEEILGTPMP